MTPQTTRNLFLNNTIDLDPETIRTILESIKLKALLTHCMKDIIEREDNLERQSTQSRKKDEIRRSFDSKNCHEKSVSFSEESQPNHHKTICARFHRFVGSKIQAKYKYSVCAWLYLINSKRKCCTKQEEDYEYKK